MSGDDTSTYAPKSPDLSSFYAGGPTSSNTTTTPSTTPHYLQPATQQYIPPQHQRDIKKEPPAYGYGYGYGGYSSSASSSYIPPQQRHVPPSPVKQEYQPYSLPQAQQQAPPPQQYQPYTASNLRGQGLGSDPSPAPAPAPYGGLPPSGYTANPYGQPVADQSPYPGGPYTPTQPYQPPSSRIPSLEQAQAETMPRKSAAAAASPKPAIEPSPVRTKFPTARIKRIMQADEEVGKVAQQTPIAVGKALELFMVQLVSRSADVAQDKGSKRVTAAMLKQVVEADDQWDFLREIVSRVENDKEKPKAKAESDSDSDFDEPKKGRAAGRRRKKV